METSHHEGVEAHGQGQALPEGWWGADVFWQLSHEEGVTRTMSAEAVARIERCHAYLLGRASGGRHAVWNQHGVWRLGHDPCR